MPKTLNEKQVMLQQYKDKLASTSGYIVVSADKLDSVTLTDLKKKLKESGANLSVVKNTIFKIALRESNQPVQTQDFTGSSALITYSADPTEAAKLLKKIQKDKSIMDAKFGVVEGVYVDNVRVMSLADIPSRPELLAKLLGSLNAPLSGFMNAVTGNVKELTRVLQAISEKK